MGEYGFPAYSQLAAVRVGTTLLGVVQWEITTEAGARIKQHMSERAPTGIERTAIIGLANGYMQYLTTPEEYQQQTYEGGSTLYGPNTMNFVRHRLGSLSASLASDSPIVRIDEIVAYPGRYQSYFARPTRGPQPSQVRRVIESISCAGAELLATWIDAHPGVLIPADGQVVEIREGDTAVAWDDHQSVEVRALKSLGKTGYRWEVRWLAGRPLTRDHRLVLVERHGLVEVSASCP